MNIKKVSKISGVDASTLRLYEEAGLLNISRDSNGDRIYNIDDIKAIHTIKLLKYFEIELAEIQKVMDGEITLESMKAVSEEKLDKQDSDFIQKKQALHLFDAGALDKLIEDPEWYGDFYNPKQYLESATPSIKQTLKFSLHFLGPILIAVFYIYFKWDVFIWVKYLTPIWIYFMMSAIAMWDKILRFRSPYRDFAQFMSFLVWIGNLLSLLFLQEIISIHYFTDSNSTSLVENNQVVVFLMIGSVLLYMATLFRDEVKYTLLALLIMLGMFYIDGTSVTDIKKDGSLIRYSFMDLMGKSYDLDAIIKYEVVGQKRKISNPHFYVYTEDFKIDIIGIQLKGDLNYYNYVEIDNNYKEMKIEKIIKNYDKCYWDKDECENLSYLFDK